MIFSGIILSHLNIARCLIPALGENMLWNCIHRDEKNTLHKPIIFILLLENSTDTFLLHEKWRAKQSKSGLNIMQEESENISVITLHIKKKLHF